MSEDNVMVRLKLGENEIEIRSKKEDLKEIIGILQSSLFPSLIQKQPQASEAPAQEDKVTIEELPQIKIEKDESLPSIILKMFSTPWGRKPRKLSEVKQALESYGLVYPKQSIAVALLRLTQSGKIRRFKGTEEEYVYTASTELLARGEQHGAA